MPPDHARARAASRQPAHQPVAVAVAVPSCPPPSNRAVLRRPPALTCAD